MTSKPEKQAIEETLKKIKTDHSVASIASPFETGTISKDGSVAYADITYKKAADDITDASVSHIKHSLSAAGDKGLQTELSGDVPGPVLKSAVSLKLSALCWLSSFWPLRLVH